MCRGLYDERERRRVRCPMCSRLAGEGVIRMERLRDRPVWQFYCHSCERSFYLDMSDEERAERERRFNNRKSQFEVIAGEA